MRHKDAHFSLAFSFYAYTDVMKRPLLIAHRGDRKHFPENTLEAFQSAFQKGADGVEMDLQLVDGEIRVIHDYMFDVKKQYPLFEEVIAQVGSFGRLELEVKAFSPEIFVPLRKLIDTYRPKDIELTSSELPLISALKGAFPEFSVGVNFDQCHYRDWMDEAMYIRKTVSVMKMMHAQVVHLSNLPEERLTSTLIAALHEAGYRAHFHIGNGLIEEQRALLERLTELQVDQCTFDDTALLVSLD